MDETKNETTERLGASLPQSDTPLVPTRWYTRAAGDPPGTALGPFRPKSRVITYMTDVEDLMPDQFGGFFVGWSAPPTRNQFAAVLRCSYRAVVALDSTTVVPLGSSLPSAMVCLPLSCRGGKRCLTIRAAA